MTDYDVYNSMSSQALKHIYQQSTKSTHILPNVNNHLIQAFLSPKNLAYMIQEIEKTASESAGFPIKLQLDSDVVNTIIRVAMSNAGFSRYPLAQAIAYMNAQVVQHESMIAYESIVLKMLYHKYYIENDRMFVMPYGESTHEPKGDSILESSGYFLTHPWKRARPEALLYGNGMVPPITMIENGNKQMRMNLDPVLRSVQDKIAPIYSGNVSYITDTSRVPPPKDSLALSSLLSKYNEVNNPINTMYAPICGYLQPKNSSFPSNI
jgi:hypothetical protein